MLEWRTVYALIGVLLWCVFPKLGSEEGNAHALCARTGRRLNIKMSSYQFRDHHVEDKKSLATVLSLTWESQYLVKTVFTLRRGPGGHHNSTYSILFLTWHNRPIHDDKKIILTHNLTIVTGACEKRYLTSDILGLISQPYSWQIM